MLRDRFSGKHDKCMKQRMFAAKRAAPTKTPAAGVTRGGVVERNQLGEVIPPAAKLEFNYFRVV